MTRIDNLAVGDTLTPLEKNPTRTQLFRYSAITWNSHRIHYDAEHARSEGHPDVLVQSHMHGAVIQQLLMNWLGPDGELVGLSWSNVGRATPGQPLSVGATVISIDGESGTIELETWTQTNENRCAEGTATVCLF